MGKEIIRPGRQKVNIEYRAGPKEQISPAFVSLIVRLQIEDIIRQYEHLRFTDMMNI